MYQGKIRTDYYALSGELLVKIKHKFACDDDDNNCDHCTDIDMYYHEIVHCLSTASSLSIPEVPKAALKHYWSAALDELKFNSKTAYDVWLNAGKPNQGFVFERMRQSKYVYKLAIRDAVKAYENMYTDELYESMLTKDMKTFWKKWKSKQCGKNYFTPNVDGFNNDKDIAELFKHYFATWLLRIFMRMGLYKLMKSIMLSVGSSL